jgi:hypothetical protein
MDRDVEYTPIIGKMGALKGFISGTLMAGGLFVSYGAALQAALFIIGLLVFMDAIIPANRGLFAISTVFFMLVGAVIEFVASAADAAAGAWPAVMLMLAAVIYAARLKSLAGFTKILKR